jgi:rhodanese-related sulfurtransferase
MPLACSLHPEALEHDLGPRSRDDQKRQQFAVLLRRFDMFRSLTDAVIKLVLLSGLLLAIHPASAADAAKNSEFPLRWRYPDVRTLDTEQFFKMMKDVTVVDARTKFEWEVMHVNGALNVPVDEVDTGKSRSFEKGMEKLLTQIPKTRPIVFYCNGKTCPKSYEAARRTATRVGFANVYAYDAGIADWVKAYPEVTTLLDKTPVTSDDLISAKVLAAHTLAADAFMSRASNPDCKCIILDIRDIDQRDFNIFPMREAHVALDNQAGLNAVLDRAKSEHKTLYVYDAVGKQIQWVQYYLARRGLTDYFFLKNGESGYVASLK